MMTGKDLVAYILENDLLDTPVYKDGKLLGFITAEEAAVKFDVGLATIKVWINRGMLDGIKIGDVIFISATATKPMEELCLKS